MYVFEASNKSQTPPTRFVKEGKRSREKVDKAFHLIVDKLKLKIKPL